MLAILQVERYSLAMIVVEHFYVIFVSLDFVLLFTKKQVPFLWSISLAPTVVFIIYLFIFTEFSGVTNLELMLK